MPSAPLWRPCATDRAMNSPPFDRALALDNLGGDEDLFKRIAAVFIADWPQREAHLREALAAGATEQLRAAAHAIKGAASNFAAERAVEAARRLEMSCKTGDLADAPAQANALLDHVGELLAALRAELR